MDGTCRRILAFFSKLWPHVRQALLYPKTVCPPARPSPALFVARAGRRRNLAGRRIYHAARSRNVTGRFRKNKSTPRVVHGGGINLLWGSSDVTGRFRNHKSSRMHVNSGVMNNAECRQREKTCALRHDPGGIILNSRRIVIIPSPATLLPPPRVVHGGGNNVDSPLRNSPGCFRSHDPWPIRLVSRPVAMPGAAGTAPRRGAI